MATRTVCDFCDAPINDEPCYGSSLLVPSTYRYKMKYMGVLFGTVVSREKEAEEIKEDPWMVVDLCSACNVRMHEFCAKKGEFAPPVEVGTLTNEKDEKVKVVEVCRPCTCKGMDKDTPWWSSWRRQ